MPVSRWKSWITVGKISWTYWYVTYVFQGGKSQRSTFPMDTNNDHTKQINAVYKLLKELATKTSL